MYNICVLTKNVLVNLMHVFSKFVLRNHNFPYIKEVIEKYICIMYFLKKGVFTWKPKTRMSDNSPKNQLTQKRRTHPSCDQLTQID